nr:hypothetical protein [Tanacetum cinerariifolium]
MADGYADNEGKEKTFASLLKKNLLKSCIGKPFKDNTGLEEDLKGGVIWFKIGIDKTIFNMPRAERRFRKLTTKQHSMMSPILKISNEDMAKGISVARPKFNKDAKFDLKGQFVKELRDNTFSGSENKDANEHIERLLEIVDLFTTLDVTQDQLMLRVFPISLTGTASRWLRNQLAGSITTWEILKGKFLSKYYLPSRTAKRIKEINNFQQESDETLYQA